MVVASDESLEAEDTGFSLKVQKMLGLISLGALERGQASGRRGNSIVGVFNPQQLFGQEGNSMKGDAPQSHFHFLVLLFSSAFGLHMKPRGGCPV